MILPGSYAFAMLLLIFGLLCWGSWINTFKMSREGWRFELYYFDFAIGLVATAVLAALTFGSLGFDGFSLTDDILHAGKRQLLFGAVAGMLFNLGNMFLVGAVSIAGMAFSFPICLGVALAVTAAWSYVAAFSGTGGPLLTGAVVILAAVVFAVLGYRSFAEIKLLEKIQSGKAKSTKKIISMKGVIVGAVGGLFMGLFLPFLDMAQAPEVGVGPYASAVLLAIGVMLSTFVYNLFFMNLPVEGEPVEITSYFRTSFRNHILGLFGGMVWCIGLVAILVAQSAEGAAKLNLSLGGVPQAAPLLAVLWGVFVWKELAGSDVRVKVFLGVMSVLYLIGLGILSTAPAMAR